MTPPRRLLPLLVCGLIALGSADVTALPELGPQKTIGQPSCAGCHFDQNDWWFRDAHSLASLALQEQDPRFSRFVLIADRYEGLGAKTMASADSVCMACHGTAITAKPGTLDFGISCESCHGPAEVWIGSHREGDKALGRERPGYVRALWEGMRELKALPVVGKTCTDCHYITDRKLRMAGHPDGVGWDLANLMQKIDHWSTPLAGYAELSAAFDGARAERGVPPVVERPIALRVVGKRSVARPGMSRFARRARTRPSRRSAGSGGDSKRLDLPPLRIDDDLSVAEKLVLLAERLDAINSGLR